MRNPARFLGVDLGASSGRVMAAHWDGRKFELEEIHRFSNSGVFIGGRLYWDILFIWSQMLAGFSRYRALYHESPVAIGVDAWGIDFGLLDRSERLLSNPVHYRDKRTEGIPEKLFSIIDPESLFSETALQPWRINTLFQLYSMVLTDDPQLQCASTLLTIPDLFSYFLSGVKRAEYTAATTTQLFSLHYGRWADNLLSRVGIPVSILPPVAEPGTVLGGMLPAVTSDCGFEQKIQIVSVASHDTAAAAAAIPHMDPDSAFISSGTWSLMGIEIAQPHTTDQARRLGFTNEGAANGKFLLLKNLTGLWVIQECLRKWEKDGHSYSWADLFGTAASATPFRSLLEPNEPCFDLQIDMPAAVQQYCIRTGQPIPEAPGAFARALFESLALKYRSVLGSLELLTGKKLNTIRVVGGGSRNAMLCQMIADACNRLVVAGPDEATSLGNVMMQAIATGHISDFEAGRIAVAQSCQCQSYEPRSSYGWDEAHARFQTLELKG